MPPGQKSSGFKQRLLDHAKGPMGLASIGEELRYALADIRQKVVEEGVYGRGTTPEFTGIHGNMEPAADEKIGAGFKERCRDAYERHAEGPADQGAPAPERE